MSLCKHILVPFDGSETSGKALAQAIAVARDQGASLRIVHAIDELAYLSGFEYSGQAAAFARDEALKMLEKAKLDARAAGVEADTRLIELPGQRLGETIAEAARAAKADLIVVGTHGRRGFSRTLLGSGAEQVIRMAPVPVLVVRANGA